jgi:hypothetical protein
MKYKVLFNHYTVRKSPILSEYRPDWCCDSKPEYNCAGLLFSDITSINPGEQHQCELEPLIKKLWANIKVGDILKCMEGNRQVGDAVILDIDDCCRDNGFKSGE